MQQRSPRTGFFQNGQQQQSELKMEVLRKISSCTHGNSDRSVVGFRKWWLLCSFLVTAGLLIVYLCYVEAHSGIEERLIETQSVSKQEDFQVNYTSGFEDMIDAFQRWDERVGCARFMEQNTGNFSRPAAGQQDPQSVSCQELKMRHVGIHVAAWTWIPDNLDNLYSCDCGLTCLWTKSRVLVDTPDASFFELHKPPLERQRGEALRIFIELESHRNQAPSQDIFVSYHASSDIQATYAGALFHNTRSYYISPKKNKDVLVYWSSSRCLPERQEIARKVLPLVSHHSFGKCLNNVGGSDVALDMYPKCRQPGQDRQWEQHLHCAMSHYKFVLAIENTMTESYVTEKLFYALDAGAIPIYFGAPNVEDFVPPNSIIDGSKFENMESLAEYIHKVGNDPVAYAEYHAWRRCGLSGNYYWTRALSLDTLPCRLCARVSKLGGKNYYN